MSFYFSLLCEYLDLLMILLCFLQNHLHLKHQFLTFKQLKKNLNTGTVHRVLSQHEEMNVNKRASPSCDPLTPCDSRKKREVANPGATFATRFPKNNLVSWISDWLTVRVRFQFANRLRVYRML